MIYRKIRANKITTNHTQYVSIHYKKTTMSKLELIFSKIVQDSQDYGSNNEQYDIENILHNRWKGI